MAEKQQSTQDDTGSHAEVFRQFAWNLAGSIAATRGSGKPAKTGSKR
ncbi:MAG TPA: hypothetical protein VHB74_16525 [Devosia sp.]|nr:hypothetical protein [Devosia sp.]